jgi:hypothetical protein
MKKQATPTSVRKKRNELIFFNLRKRLTLLYRLGCFLFIVAPFQAQAGPERGLFFYRSPQSLFPSGQISRKELEQGRTRTENDKTYLIEKDSKQMWLPASQVLRDMDLSLSLTADGLPQMQDLGAAINLIPCSLRAKSDWTSDMVTFIPALTKMKVISYESTWAQVEYHDLNQTLRGFVDLNNLVLKSDFASFVLTDKNQWRPVLYRELSELVLDQKEKINLNKIKELITRPERGIISQANAKFSLNLKSQVTIHRLESGEWNVSQLKGHGEVFWKYETPEVWQEPDQSDELTTDQILKREITSVAFHPENPKWGILSSQGIFITTDGEKWAPVKSFGHRNYPVAISSHGDIVVGSYISYNFTKSFEPYLRWEQLTKIIESRTKKNLHTMQMKEVAFLSTNELKITLDTGTSHSVSLKGSPKLQNSWQYISK